MASSSANGSTATGDVSLSSLPSAGGGKSQHPSHITSKIASLQSSSPSQPFWSLEFFPPKTEQGQANLLSRMARMTAELLPSWANVTWGAGGTTQVRSLELAGRAQNGVLDPAVPLEGLVSQEQKDVAKKLAASATASLVAPQATDEIPPLDSCLHLTCTNVDKQSLDETLAIARRQGIRNILALRGDPPRGDEYWVAADTRFQRATDLVAYIQQEHGDIFCVGVAAYPEGYCDSVEQDVERDVRFLKAKQDAGAQFAITQLFYDADVFLKWYQRCREAGITIPIIPGIMPIQNYQSFRRMTNLCKTKVPQEVLQALEPIRFDDAAVKDYGVQLAISMVGRIYLETDIRGFHLCTLNLEKSVRRVLEGLGWVQGGDSRGLLAAPQQPPMTPAAVQRDYKLSTQEALARASLASKGSPAASKIESATWDEFPNGRFGDARSPAFGEIDGYGASLKVPPADALKIWGYPVTEDDISVVFSSYLADIIQCVPWCDTPIYDETLAIQSQLLSLNLPAGAKSAATQGKGWWTVGSQPAVDGVSSSNPVYGFGPRDGYVYQKAFVEFFVSETDKSLLQKRIEEEGDGMISFFAGNRRGDFETNMPAGEVDAVTWGVFPGKEVAQPTIIEEESFRAWRDEAFAIWAEWESLFPKRSATGKLLKEIGERRWLMTVVHHDYKSPDALWNFLGAQKVNPDTVKADLASRKPSKPPSLSAASLPASVSSSSVDPALAQSHKTTVVSSPGKVLIAGGYLVLSPAYPGLVIATESRFYSVVAPAAGEPTKTATTVPITIRSPQFVDATWRFLLDIEAGTLQLSQSSADSEYAGRSPFLCLSLIYALALAYQKVPADDLRRKLDSGLDVWVLADNDFYSQREPDSSSAPSSSQLRSLAAFNPLGCAISKVHKTGLGSSAALTTSFVSSLLVHLGVVEDETLASDEDLVWLHNTAQLAHCAAQGKVGSGFDVSSAVWGSQIYRRFDPKALETLLSAIPECAVEGQGESTRLKDLSDLTAHLSPSQPLWKPSPLSDKTAPIQQKEAGAHPTAFEGLHYTSLSSSSSQLPRPAPLQLPPNVHLLLADVDAGSNTPSLVSKVMAWKTKKPEWSQQLYNVLATSNQSLADALLSLSLLSQQDPQKYTQVLAEASSQKSKAWPPPSARDDPEDPMTHFVAARNALRSIRAGMRELGKLSGAPIEPDEMGRVLQTVIDSVDGVVGGGVPGAGGYDALYLIYTALPGEEHERKRRQEIEDALFATKEKGLSVGLLLTGAGEARSSPSGTGRAEKPVLLQQASGQGGLRTEKINKVAGLAERCGLSL